MRRPSLTPYTMYSQEATQYAQEHGKFNEFHHAAYKALWTDGKNLADFQILKEITESCGLDWPELEQRLKSGHYRGIIQAQHQEALDLGVHAIPSFLIGKYVFSGAHPYDFFKRVTEKVLAEQQVSQ